MLTTSSITYLNCWIWLFDCELNLTRLRLGLGLRASSTCIWLSGWHIERLYSNIFLFKEDIKWQKYFYALYKTNIDCSLSGKLCKILPSLTGDRRSIFPSTSSREILAHVSSHLGELFCTISSWAVNICIILSPFSRMSHTHSTWILSWVNLWLKSCESTYLV